MSLPFPTLTPDEAAALVQHGQTVAFTGFTSAGSAKFTAPAIAKRAKAEHAAGRPFKVGVLTGASTGPSCDGALAAADAVAWRTPYQSDATLRKAINEGRTAYFDMHLSGVAQSVRIGALPKINWAFIEVAEIHADGCAIPTTSVGISPTMARMADKIIIEVNDYHPSDIRGLHDIYEPMDPPHRKPIMIRTVRDRIGEAWLRIPPEKIAGIVYGRKCDEVSEFSETDAVTDKIGQNVAEFLAQELRIGRIPKEFLPVQSGVGNIANAVLGAMGANPDVPAFELYSEVIQDSVIGLMAKERIRFASGTALALSPKTLDNFYTDRKFYMGRTVLRPQEISNSPEVIRRLGLIAVNTALELDLGGNVNSTHVLGKSVMNGLGGSGDFARNAYLSIFTCPSIQKNGKISTVVPLVSHMDHSEHSVQIVATEQGVADLRGKDPRQRAELIIEKCAHPMYRDILRETVRMAGDGHHFQHPDIAWRLHANLQKTGDMLKDA